MAISPAEKVKRPRVAAARDRGWRGGRRKPRLANRLRRKNHSELAREKTLRKAAEAAVSRAAALDKSLSALHSAVDVESFWKAVQRVLSESFPLCNLGITLQHNPVRPLTAKWRRAVPDGPFDSTPLEDFLRAHPRIKIVCETDVFPVRSDLLRSMFYRDYMKPNQCEHALGLLFWRRQRLSCIIIMMRTAEQGPLSEVEMKLLRRLYGQFQIALRRIRSVEREHSARAAFESFLRGLPLPTMLLRWNLKLAYENKAAREFCLAWREGPDASRLVKANAEVPEEILDGCRRLKKRWERATKINAAQPSIEPEVVHHSERHYLRVVISITHLNNLGVIPPHFLVQCEQRRGRGSTAHSRTEAQLAHLAHLTPREQEVTRRACEGRTNQEIADETGLSVQMVKKHLHAIFRKLEVTSRSRLMALMQ